MTFSSLCKIFVTSCRINASLQELCKLDYAKYPALDKKEYNTYCSRFKSFKTLYTHMINGFPKEEIIEILDGNLTIYFEKIEKSLVNYSNSYKIESEVSYKQ